MLNRVKLLSGAALLSLSFGANAVVVDLFDVAQGPLTDNTTNGADTGTTITSGVGSSVSGSSSSLLGGNRDLYVSKLSDPLNLGTRKAEASIGGGVFDFSTSTSTTGRAQIQWDGSENTNAIDYTGLGGVDLTDGGSLSTLALKVIFSDAGFNFKITAYTNSTDYTEVTIAANEHPAPVTTSIDLGVFSLATGSYLGGTVNVVKHGTGGDITNLGALVADIDQFGDKTSLDLTLDSATTVPEPGILALMGLGLLGMSSAKIRRNKK